MQRKDEILAKKAKLAELRRQREEREQRQKEGRRESLLDDGAGVKVPTPRRSTDRQELDSFIETLVGDRPGSRGPGTGTASPAGKRSRPSSTLSAVQIGSETYEQAQGSATHLDYATASTQTTGTGNLPKDTVENFLPAKSADEVLTYSKAVQTAEEWSSHRRRKSADGDSASDLDEETGEGRSPMLSKRSNRRQREREEELRQYLRREIEEELKVAKDSSLNGHALSAPSKFPARSVTNEELNAVISSKDFLDFVERSSKVIEKTLDQDYDVLADYALDGVEGVSEDEEEGYGSSRGKKGRRIRQIAQFYDERWCKKRMISDMGFSTKVSIVDPTYIGRLIKISSPNSFSLLIRRMRPHHKTPRASSKYGTCTYILAPSTPSTARQIFSPQNSHLFILPSSLGAHTAAKCYCGTLAQEHLIQSRKLP